MDDSTNHIVAYDRSRIAPLADCNALKEKLLIREVKGALYSLFHHTNIGAFVGMILGKGVWLSRIDKMNDGTEIFVDADRTYAFCVSAAPTENIGMWIAYGVPRKDAIRLRFSGKALLKVCNDKNGEVWVRPIKNNVVKKGSVKGKATLQYVGYVSDSGRRVRVSDRIYELPPNAFASGQELMQKCGSFVKLSGWRYENEIRLVVRLEEKIDAERIQLDLPEVINSLLTYVPVKRKNSKGMPSVIVGPWCSRENFLLSLNDASTPIAKEDKYRKYFLDHVNDDQGIVRESKYLGKISLGHCDRCNSKQNCRCCYCEIGK